MEPKRDPARPPIDSDPAPAAGWFMGVGWVRTSGAVNARHGKGEPLPGEATGHESCPRPRTEPTRSTDTEPTRSTAR